MVDTRRIVRTSVSGPVNSNNLDIGVLNLPISNSIVYSSAVDSESPNLSLPTTNLSSSNSVTITTDSIGPSLCSTGSSGENLSPQMQNLLEILRRDQQEFHGRMEAAQEDFCASIRNRIDYLKQRTEIQDQPDFKSAANLKHYKRTQYYKSFINDTKLCLLEGDQEGALGHLEGFNQALCQFERDLKLADSSAAGWTLVDRLKEDHNDQRSKNIRALEKEILEERRGTEVTQVDKSAKRGRNGQGSFGPCVWCGLSGHGYAYCRVLQADIEGGRAKFNTQTRKWERVQQPSG